MTQEALQQVGPVEDMLLRRAVLRSAKIVSDGRFVTKQAALDIAPPLPVQEPVAYDKTEMNSFVIDLYDKKMQEGKHGHYETMFHVVHQAIKRVTPPLPVQEPLEYWNAVEGWVKIDEVREHFDAVNCGTIYTAPPQRQWVGLTVTTILNMMPSTIPADYDGELMEFARAVEAKLKEKNHG